MFIAFVFSRIKARKSSEDIDSLCYQGFYPRIHQQHLNPTEALSFYFRTYVEPPIRTLSQIKNLHSFERFVRLCAIQVGQLINFSQLANDCGVDQKTIN